MTGSPPARRAFVDESFRSQRGGDGVYLLGAVVVPATLEDDLRTDLRRATAGAASRLHWHEDRPATRRRGLRVMNTYAAHLEGVTTAIHGVRRHRQERSRGHALWNLVFELVHRGVTDIVFEARERRQNDKDVETLQRIFAVPGLATARYAFGRPLDEPLLWLPDYLVGAIGGQLAGDAAVIDPLPDRLTRRIDLDAR